MKKLKSMILLLVVIIAIILALIIIMNENNNNNNNNNSSVVYQEENQNQEQESTIELNIVENQAMYFTVESCIDTYISYVINQDKVSVFKVLDISYIQEKNITEDNVLEFTGNISSGTDFDIQKMLLVEGKEEKLQKYYVYGILRNKEAEKLNKENSYITVNVDLENMIFSVIPNVPDEGVFYEQ